MPSGKNSNMEAHISNTEPSSSVPSPFSGLERGFFVLSVVNQLPVPFVPLQILNALVENGDAKLKSTSSPLFSLPILSLGIRADSPLVVSYINSDLVF